MESLRTLTGGHHHHHWLRIALLMAVMATNVGAAAVRGNYLGCFADPKNALPVMALFKEGSAESCVDRCEERYFR